MTQGHQTVSSAVSDNLETAGSQWKLEKMSTLVQKHFETVQYFYKMHFFVNISKSPPVHV